MNKQPIHKEVLMVGIAGLVAIQIAGMYFGIDGVLRAAVVGAICAVLGISLPQLKLK